MKKLYYYRTFAGLMLLTIGLYSCLTAASENNLTKQLFVAAAESYVMNALNPNHNKKIKVSIMPIDKRVAIPACETNYTFTSSPEALSQSNITVKGQCITSNWYMFLVIKAIEIQPVVVLSSAVSPGTLLTRQNLQVIEMDKKRLRTATFADIEDVVGARIKRRMTSGRPVESSNLCYVCKGDSVVISAGSNGMRVKTTGIALEDGSMGETIRVKNRRSSKQIYARVASTGQVEVSI